MRQEVAPEGAVTIVTQTRVAPGHEAEFLDWQEGMSGAAAQQAGFLGQQVIAPSGPGQVDWVILQRFASAQAAQSWMASRERTEGLQAGQHLLAGHADIHILRDKASGVLPSPACAVISTRVKPGREDDYRAWERRIAAAQARAPGFQGYRLEPPVPGVQDKWLAIVRFDSEASLAAWMKSPERLELVAQAESLSDEVQARVVRTGFDQWFADGTAASQPPTWKQNMIVLLQLYPVVFLFGLPVQGPVLERRLHMPFWLALFVGNVAGVLLLNWLVPWASRRFAWWLDPGLAPGSRTNLLGVLLILALYAVCLAAFALLSTTT